MAVSLSAQPVVTDAGTAKVLLVEDGDLSLIDPANLPGGTGGGGGDGFNPYSVGGVYPLPGHQIINTVSVAAAADGQIRAYLIERQPDRGLGLYFKKVGAGASLFRVGLYKAPAGGSVPTGATLVADLGEVSLSAADSTFTTAAMPAMTDAASRYFVVTFSGVQAGTQLSVTVNTALQGAVPLDPTVTSAIVRVRFDGTLTYPAACPETLPTMTNVAGATFSVPVMLQRVA